MNNWLLPSGSRHDIESRAHEPCDLSGEHLFPVRGMAPFGPKELFPTRGKAPLLQGNKNVTASLIKYYGPGILDALVVEDAGGGRVLCVLGDDSKKPPATRDRPRSMKTRIGSATSSATTPCDSRPSSRCPDQNDACFTQRSPWRDAPSGLCAPPRALLPTAAMKHAPSPSRCEDIWTMPTHRDEGSGAPPRRVEQSMTYFGPRAPLELPQRHSRHSATQGGLREVAEPATQHASLWASLVKRIPVHAYLGTDSTVPAHVNRHDANRTPESAHRHAADRMPPHARPTSVEDTPVPAFHHGVKRSPEPANRHGAEHMPPHVSLTSVEDMPVPGNRHSCDRIACVHARPSRAEDIAVHATQQGDDCMSAHARSSRIEDIPVHANQHDAGRTPEHARQTKREGMPAQLQRPRSTSPRPTDFQDSYSQQGSLERHRKPVASSQWVVSRTAHMGPSRWSKSDFYHFSSGTVPPPIMHKRDRITKTNEASHDRMSETGLRSSRSTSTPLQRTAGAAFPTARQPRWSMLSSAENSYGRRRGVSNMRGHSGVRDPLTPEDQHSARSHSRALLARSDALFKMVLDRRKLAGGAMHPLGDNCDQM